MKNILIASLLMLSLCHTRAAAQNAAPEQEVAAALALLVKGFEQADGAILGRITADELSYGHSSGKVQNREEFIAEIVSGEPFRYRNIRLSDQTVRVVKETAVVRHVFAAETLSPDGVPGALRINNLLIWQYREGQWKLLARQAFR
jgi:hypothetical protein